MAIKSLLHHGGRDGKWKVDGEAGWCSVDRIAHELSVQDDHVYEA
jgi:hypothetical protein